jgi:hypothetical protein
MEFPLYRKYANNKSFFEILSNDTFRELKITGQRFELIVIHAAILPERNYIQDLIHNEQGYYEETDAFSFNQQLEYCQTFMQPF